MARKSDLVYCCESLEEAVGLKLLIIREGELTLKGEHPKKAGNVITGETYNPKEFIFTMVVSYCPFCGKEVKCDKNGNDISIQ